MQSTNTLAALVLFLTPAISVELLTGNTPLAAYLHPLTFIILNIVYGGTLLLYRESIVRWGKGFASMLVLAAGYGMINEAVGTKAFFDPHYYSVKEFGLEGFGRMFGINVPWALKISIVHAVFSILVPFTIVTTIFPGTDRWIGRRLYAALIAALAAVCVFTFLVFTIPPSYYHYYDVPRGPLLLILALIGLDIWAAWKLPEVRSSRWDIRLSSWTLFVIGALYAAAFFILPNIARKSGSPALYDAFLLVFFVATPILLVFKLPEPAARGKVALSAGLLAPMIAVSLIHVGLIPAAAVSALLAAAWGRAAPANLH